MKNILITGGAGFIGSHVVRRFVKQYPHYRIINGDSLTYGGNLDNVSDICDAGNYVFERMDIRDMDEIRAVFLKYAISDVVHLAAESHVDRAISGPLNFVRTNIVGTANLLEVARGAWEGDFSTHLFYHVSTDEVYGSLGASGYFTEDTHYDPHSPYSASKAASDHLVRSYFDTYGFPVVISNCSNNFGPNQFPEKLIPLLINNIILRDPLPVYGDGKNIRDWLFVEDHARAIDLIFHKGKTGDTYTIGAGNEWSTIDLAHLLCRKMDIRLGRALGESEQLITFVRDRPGHDRRYAIDATKIQLTLGWYPSGIFEERLDDTIDWYLTNRDWNERVISGVYAASY